LLVFLTCKQLCYDPGVSTTTITSLPPRIDWTCVYASGFKEKTWIKYVEFEEATGGGPDYVEPSTCRCVIGEGEDRPADYTPSSTENTAQA